MRRIVGKLLAAMKLMHYLRQTHDFHTLLKVEKCFASDWSYVRKPKELEGLLREYRDRVFQRPQ